MNTPKIQALGIVQQGSPSRWKARGYVEGIGWLEARGTSLILAGETVIGGSFNYTKAAHNQNAENVEITRSQGLTAKYTENWQAHAQHSERYMGRGASR